MLGKSVFEKKQKKTNYNNSLFRQWIQPGCIKSIERKKKCSSNCDFLWEQFFVLLFLFLIWLHLFFHTKLKYDNRWNENDVIRDMLHQIIPFQQQFRSDFTNKHWTMAYSFLFSKKIKYIHSTPYATYKWTFRYEWSRKTNDLFVLIMLTWKLLMPKII